MTFSQSQNLRLENPAASFGANLVGSYCGNESGRCLSHQTVRSWQGNLFGRKTAFRLEVFTT